MEDTAESIVAAKKWAERELEKIEKEHQEALEILERRSAQLDKVLGLTPEEIELTNRDYN